MAVLFLIACAAVLAWLGSLYLWPFGLCGKCQGSGRNAGSNRKRFGDCPRCAGSGRRQRLGSTTVHRMVRDTITYRRGKRGSPRRPS
jgi:hypothetical protein